VLNGLSLGGTVFVQYILPVECDPLRGSGCLSCLLVHLSLTGDMSEARTVSSPGFTEA
jgi:hypothetical protein